MYVRFELMYARFELTTNSSSPADDAICQGISTLGYWKKVNQSPTQTNPYNNDLCLEVLLGT